MDERFENPSEEAEDEESHESTTATEEQPDQQGTAGTVDTESSTEETEEIDGEPLNIREDWDSATIYVEPKQSEDIEVTFTRLKKQLKREDATLEKNKHFYRGIFEMAFSEYREETKEKIRELAKEDGNQ
jgi:hypothetical protein